MICSASIYRAGGPVYEVSYPWIMSIKNLLLLYFLRTFDEKNVKLYELMKVSYKELVSEADTGLTIVVLVDKDSKDRLLQQFAKIVHNYSR